MTAKHCFALALIASTAGLAAAADAPVVGLITKTETNPFFVKMKEGAQQAAKLQGAKLLTGAGKSDGDNAGQRIVPVEDEELPAGRAVDRLAQALTERREIALERIGAGEGRDEQSDADQRG